MHAEASRRKVDLPLYPFQHRQYWFKATRSLVGHTSPGTAAAQEPEDAPEALTFVSTRPASQVESVDAWLVPLEPEEREAALAEYLRKELARAVALPVEEVDPDAHFLTLGVDSLMATELVGVLERAGHTVLQAANGREALALLDRAPTDVHLVVTDLVMPEMGGRDLRAALRQRRPALPIVFMSGYDEEQALHEQGGDDGFLPKPFTPADLGGATGTGLARCLSVGTRRNGL